MASGGMPPNDPMFFLHHANVDRLWAMWQNRNRENAAAAVDYGNPGYPGDWRGEGGRRSTSGSPREWLGTRV